MQLASRSDSELESTRTSSVKFIYSHTQEVLQTATGPIQGNLEANMQQLEDLSGLVLDTRRKLKENQRKLDYLLDIIPQWFRKMVSTCCFLKREVPIQKAKPHHFSRREAVNLKFRF